MRRQHGDIWKVAQTPEEACGTALFNACMGYLHS